MTKKKWVFRRNGITTDKPAGDDWTQLEGRLFMLSVAQKNILWGIDVAGRLWYMTGGEITATDIGTNKSWQSTSGSFGF